MDTVLIVGLATAASSLVTAVIVALISSWVGRRNAGDATALALIDRLDGQVKAGDAKNLQLAEELANVRQYNRESLVRIEALEDSDRDKTRQIAGLEIDKADCQRDLRLLKELVDLRAQQAPSP